MKKENRSAVLNKECHFRFCRPQDSGIPTAFNNTQGGDPRQKSSGMTTLLNNTPSSVLTGHLPPQGEVANVNAPSTWRERVAAGRVRGIFTEEALNKNDFRAPLRSGFTLIELLVVVLIIGILATVALPQYQKAVYRSRTAEALVILPTLQQAYNLSYLTTGDWPRPQDIAPLDINIPVTRIKTNWLGTDETDSSHYYFSCFAGLCAANAADPNLPLFTFPQEGPYCIRWHGKTKRAQELCQAIGTYDEEASKRNNASYYKL